MPTPPRLPDRPAPADTTPAAVAATLDAGADDRLPGTDARERHPHRRTRPPAADGRPGTADLRAGGWLTTVLRPAGTLDRPALNRLSQALARLAASSDMVVVDLTAAQVAAPRALARSLQAPALELQQPGRCLLLVGVPPALAAELDRAAVRVATLAAETLAGTLPLPAI